MAADNHTTIIGNLVEDPELRFTNNGIAVTNLRVAVTQRIQQDGEWRDGETSLPQGQRLARPGREPGRLARQGRPGHGHRPAAPALLGDPRRRQAVGHRDRGRRGRRQPQVGHRQGRTQPPSAATATAPRAGSGRPNAAATSTTLHPSKQPSLPAPSAQLGALDSGEAQSESEASHPCQAYSRDARTQLERSATRLPANVSDRGCPFGTGLTRSMMTHDKLRTLRHMCDFVTNGVRESFVEYFKSIGIDVANDISISVKLLMSPEEVLQAVRPKSQEKRDEIRSKPHWIVTVYRDHETHMHHPKREKATRIYDVDKSSAFHHIITSRNDYFRSNNLQGLDNYSNENPNWRQQYNATLVVPIRYHPWG